MDWGMLQKGRLNLNIRKTFENQKGLSMEWIALEGNGFLSSGVFQTRLLDPGEVGHPVDLDSPVMLESPGELCNLPALSFGYILI